MAGPVKDSETVVATVMAGIAVILLSGVVLRRLALRVGQPAVIGELCAGLVLGPSLLGLLPGNPTEALFPAGARPYLSVLAQVGVVLFVFLIGWEFNGRLLRGKRRVVVGVSLSSTAVPFLLGLPLALLLHRGHGVVDSEPVGKVPFVLYIGVVMSITAFPVLAKFLADRRMQHSPVGVLALASAAFGDALAWCSLAVVVVVVTAGSLLGVAAMAGWLALFLAVMVLAVRPLLARLVERMSMGTGAPYLPAVVGAGVLLSACATAWIGVHAIFGAFVFGLVMPRPVHPQLQKHALEPLEHVSLFLLPLFFIVVGLSIDLRAMSVDNALEALLVVGVACAGKLAGAAVPARLFGMSWQESRTLGLLMNMRGLTELIVLNIGVGLGLLDQEIYTVMVVMALFTTCLPGLFLRRAADGSPPDPAPGPPPSTAPASVPQKV
ncbi:cation:proton antiporter [Streptomyces sp. H28]|uniref:cation:proton antiporter n=1 Tax=Streptomyces sp. H28 TaxID=2775865 RepID=UPI0017820F8D|nr:cation:proton antiporter [Streptomyces sp. H28]MBD9733909.1 cation:proton antiporter [Streptomyces sp. H28]